MTLALASHPEVDGWDVDVIAEDHHMFCKCYFAALWELAHAQKDQKDKSKKAEQIEIKPQVEVSPIFLPACAYLVESSNGYWASLWARFEQARRHSQGVVELGYVLLQYARLTRATGFFELPFRTHCAIISIVVKMHTLHITSTAQCFSLIMAAATRLIPVVLRILSGGIFAFLRTSVAGVGVSGISALVSGSWDAMNFAQQALAASMGQVTGVSFLYTATCFIVIKDLIEGRYYEVLAQPNIVGSMPPVGEVAETNETSETAQSPKSEGASPKLEAAEGLVAQPPPGQRLPSFVSGVKSWPQRFILLLQIYADTIGVGYTAITFYAMIPVCLAAWSLFRRGTDFEYIVAVKPT
jgi:hypothetical protein